MSLLLWLEWKRAKNAVLHLGRSPARLLSAVAVVGVIGLTLLAQFAVLTSPEVFTSPILRSALSQQSERLDLTLLAMLLYLTYQVVETSFRGGLLYFVPADVNYLFPAPIARRAVLIYRLCLDYCKYGVLVCLCAGWMSAPIRLLGAQHVWDGLRYAPAALFLYLVTVLNVSHVLSLLAAFQGERMRRWGGLLRGLLLAALAGVLVVLLWRAFRPEQVAAPLALLRSRAVAVALFPLVAGWELLLTPFNGVPAHAGAKLGGLAACALVSLLALLARRENIYEPTVEVSLLRSQIRDAARGGQLQTAQAMQLSLRGRRAGAGRVPGFGRGAGAIVWRGLAIALRSPGRVLRLYLLLAILLPLGLVSLFEHLHLRFLLTVSPLLAVYGAWISTGAIFKAQQGELYRVNLLKPLPIPAWQIILAQLVPTTAGVSLGMWLAVVVFAGGGGSLDAALAVALLAPGLQLALAAMSALLACRFPNPDDPIQTLSANVAVAVGSGLLILPSAVIGQVFWQLGFGGLRIGLTAGLVNLGLAAVMVLLASWLYDWFDPTD